MQRFLNSGNVIYLFNVIFLLKNLINLCVNSYRTNTSSLSLMLDHLCLECTCCSVKKRRGIKNYFAISCWSKSEIQRKSGAIIWFAVQEGRLERVGKWHCPNYEHMRWGLGFIFTASAPRSIQSISCDVMWCDVGVTNFLWERDIDF